MGDRIKELTDITFECEYRSRIVDTCATKKLLQTENAAMSTLSRPARVRVVNERWVEDWIEYLEHCLVEDSVAHARLVYVPQFWITDIE